MLGPLWAWDVAGRPHAARRLATDAARADVEYQLDGDRACLRVSNDGVVTPPEEASGLAALAERLAAAEIRVRNYLRRR